MDSRRGESAPRSFTVQDDDAGRRLDRVLRKLLPRASLATIYTGLRKGEARIDGKIEDPRYRLRLGERLLVTGALSRAVGGERTAGDGGSAQAAGSAQAPLRADGLVLYHTADFIVFAKPKGLPVHGERSLAQVARELLEHSSRPSLSFRPGPVHRLDRDTSGLVFFALSLQGARVLSRLLRERACRKTYLALLEGTLAGREQWHDELARDEARRRTVEDREGGRAADAEVDPLLHAPGLTLARVLLQSGRTHQIRAQAAIRGHALHGDERYGGARCADSYLLHAATFRIPKGSGISVRTAFMAPLPPESRSRLAAIFGEEPLARALEELYGGLQDELDDLPGGSPALSRPEAP